MSRMGRCGLKIRSSRYKQVTGCYEHGDRIFWFVNILDVPLLADDLLAFQEWLYMQCVKIDTQIDIAYELSGIMIGKCGKTGTCILFCAVTD